MNLQLGVLVLSAGAAANLMVLAGLAKGRLECKRPRTTCPSCGRMNRRCGCR